MLQYVHIPAYETRRAPAAARRERGRRVAPAKTFGRSNPLRASPPTAPPPFSGSAFARRRDDTPAVSDLATTSRSSSRADGDSRLTLTSCELLRLRSASLKPQNQGMSIFYVVGYPTNITKIEVRVLAAKNIFCCLGSYMNYLN